MRSMLWIVNPWGEVKRLRRQWRERCEAAWEFEKRMRAREVPVRMIGGPLDGETKMVCVTANKVQLPMANSAVTEYQPGDSLAATTSLSFLFVSYDVDWKTLTATYEQERACA